MSPRAIEPRLPTDDTSKGGLPAGSGARAGPAAIVLLAGLVGLAVCLVLFGVLADGIRSQEVVALDGLVTPFLHGFASPALDWIMNAATFAGSNVCLITLTIVAVLILARLRRSGAIAFLVVTVAGAALLNGAMKLIVERPRPQLPWATVLPDYSFPSGHTMNSVAFSLAIAVIVWSIRGRRSGLGALALAIVFSSLVGVSRIYLGFHYFSDVVGGILAGTAWVLIVLTAFHAGPFAGVWGHRGWGGVPDRRTSGRQP